VKWRHRWSKRASVLNQATPPPENY
jgi:hypothetical protein